MDPEPLVLPVYIKFRLSTSTLSTQNYHMDSSNESGPDMLTFAMDSSNNQPVQDPFAMFPPEILSLVCGYLPKNDLKRVRQVSKILGGAAVSCLFDEIFISQDKADFRIAKLVIRHFRYYIRTLVFSSIYYTKWHQNSFRRESLIKFAEYSHLDSDIDSDHSWHAFTVYRTLRNKQQEIILKSISSPSSPSSPSSAYLSLALASLPNIRKIILTDTSSSRSMPSQSLQDYQPRNLKPCPVGDCDLTPADHLPDGLRQTGFSRTDSFNPWRPVLSALSTTQANIRELTMEPDNMCLGTKSVPFEMLSRAILSFRNLTKLRLSLIRDTDQLYGSRHVHRNVAKVLSNATNLESLSLDISDVKLPPSSRCSLFQDILGRCKFPKLRSLILAFFTSSDEELLRLLNHSTRLKQITINCFALAKGSWMRVADWIRASLPLLKHAELAHLYGGFDMPIDGDEYLDLYGDVDNFLFASGENPFTKKALEKYLADKAARRQAPDVAGLLGYVGAYTKYH